jgi:membrane-bound lytic murein transglycosylase D
MSMPTMRRAIVRHRAALVKGAASTALFATAGLVVAATTNHPSHVVVRPAALALTTPVSAASRPEAFLSMTAVGLTAGTSARPQSMATQPPQSSDPEWDLANIANPRVDKWVRKFTSSHKDDFEAAMERGRAFSDMIIQKLDDNDMPRELVYLPMIESEFKPKARSRVSAVGLWQFMAGTARTFGLSVGRHADERTSPSKSTDAALKYLSELHNRFGSWYLAAAAYNSGPGTVSRALRRVTGRKSGSDADFYRISPALPKETRDYVPKLIAAARVGKAAGDF